MLPMASVRVQGCVLPCLQRAPTVLSEHERDGWLSCDSIPIRAGRECTTGKASTRSLENAYCRVGMSERCWVQRRVSSRVARDTGQVELTCRRWWRGQKVGNELGLLRRLG